MTIALNGASQVALQSLTANASIDSKGKKELRFLEKETEGIVLKRNVEKRSVELEKQIEDLAKENEVLRQKLTLIHIAYTLQQNAFVNQKVLKKAPSDIIIAETVFEY